MVATIKKQIHTSKQTLAEKLIQYEGRPIDYDEFFFWPHFWDQEAKRGRDIIMTRIMLGGRQISKSSTLSVEALIESLKANNRTFYCAPQEKLAKQFVNFRLDNMMSASPKMQSLLFNRKSPLIPGSYRSKTAKVKIKDDTFSKIFVNGSYIQVSYSDGSDTTRVRGYSGDKGLIDECQSILLGSLLAVLKYILRSSKEPRLLLVGTPLGIDEFTAMYGKTTQTTFFVKCEGCNKEQSLTSMDNIDVVKRQVVCCKCGKPLDVMSGWYKDLNPDSHMYGQHANMLMLPSLRDPSATTWEIIRDVIYDEQVSEDEKIQELLGVASNKGRKFISQEDLDAMPRVDDRFDSLERITDYCPGNGVGFTIGIDWGGSTSEDTQDKTAADYVGSHTSITVSAFKLSPNQQRVEQHILFEKLFPIEHPTQTVESLKEIIRIVARSPYLRLILADAGGGAFSNALISDFLALEFPDIPFVAVQMLPNLKAKVLMDGKILQVLKRVLVTEYMRKIKKREVFRPKANAPKQFDTAVLSQGQFQDKNGILRWKRVNLQSDDLLYSAIFSYLGGLAIFDYFREITHDLTS